MSGLYDSDRLEKISRITPYFSSVAKVGDVVYRGLEGDPAFPAEWSQNRPTARITNIDRTSEGIVLTMSSNGETFQVDEHTIAPKKVWEFTDATFENVLARERAEHSLMQPQEPSVSYRGVEDMRQEIRELRSELEQERSYNRNFHNVYIQSLSEIAKDIMGVEQGTGVNFAKTFDQEYTRMRAENQMYRGSEEEEDEASDASSDNESAVGSLTDYF